MPGESNAPPLTLTPRSCALCGADEGEPVAVGEDFERHSSPDSFLALRCARCGLVYLSPAPAPHQTSPMQPNGLAHHRLYRARIRTLSASIARSGRSLPKEARILLLGPDAAAVARALGRGSARSWRVEVGEGDPDGLYDAVVLVGDLERSADPIERLRTAGRPVKPDGWLLVITRDPSCAAARVFQGRHWSGYDFPRHQILADAKVLRKLAIRAGLEVTSLTRRPDPAGWILSLHYLLLDCGAPAWLARILGPSSPPAIGAAQVLEAIQQLRGRSGLIEAVLRPTTVGREA